MNLSEDKVPATLDEAIQMLFDGLNKEDIDYIKNNSSCSVHFEFGMALRNNWSMHDASSPLKEDIKARYGVSMADDLSGLVLGGLWAKVLGQDVQKMLEEEAKRFRMHWKAQGVDPLSM